MISFSNGPVILIKIQGSAVLRKGTQNSIAIAIVISNRSLIWCAAI